MNISPIWTSVITKKYIQRIKTIFPFGFHLQTFFKMKDVSSWEDAKKRLTHICESEISDTFPRMLILEIHYVVTQTPTPITILGKQCFSLIVTKQLSLKLTNKQTFSTQNYVALNSPSHSEIRMSEIQSLVRHPNKKTYIFSPIIFLF